MEKASQNQTYNIQIANLTRRILKLETQLNSGTLSASKFSTLMTSAVVTPTPSTGAFTTASAITRYTQIGNLVFIAITVSVVTNGTGSASINVPLPLPVYGGQNYVLCGSSNLGHMLKGNCSGSVCNIVDYDNVYAGADNAVLNLTGVYEAT